MEDPEENILARVGGDYVSAALKALPNARGYWLWFIALGMAS